MRKQTKLVAVLSAAALLAIGASMTSFAAGWEKDEAGIWHYYDSDDEMVSGEWKKDGGKWFYLDDDGDMLTDAWVENEYYVGADGAMLINQWKKTTPDEAIDDPDSDGEHWYYFDSKGKKVADKDKKIGGKTYYFNDEGQMRNGWYQNNNGVYYLGGEDEGWRAENQWYWLEKPDDDDEIAICDDDCDADCKEEGWYFFGTGGKMYNDDDKKSVNGRYYFFNKHGQMLYEWINNSKVAVGSAGNAVLDGKHEGQASPSDMMYMNIVEEGWRADGWYEIEGSVDTKTDGESSWYYFKDGKAKKAEDYIGTKADGTPIWREKIRVSASGNKYFCFDEYGRMQTGLQKLKDGFYFFDDNGYMKTGKVTNVEEDDNSFTYYFNTKNGGNGRGVMNEKSGYLYWNGKRLDADDDYKLFYVQDKVYLVNKSGKIQSSKTKKYSIEGTNMDGDYLVEFANGDSVEAVYEYDKDKKDNKGSKVFDATTVDSADLGNTLQQKASVTIPAIELYDKYYTVGDDGVEDWFTESAYKALNRE